ncbi:MAG: flagellar motor protein MotA [Alphaproteobacteria bacterium]|nr:flagellar motor protein MotA [Alphaproteobacteria bacterium]MBF0249310.1 flagellar motor protein MotA [Alphaproteobacteria bacterium]
MSNPLRFLIRMALFLAAVGAAMAAVHQPLLTAFMTNAPLNGLIVGVFLLGMAYNFRQVIQLRPEVTWIDAFRESHALSQDLIAEPLVASSEPRPPRPKGNAKPRPVDVSPRMLAPLAAMVGGRTQIKLSAMALRSVLDGVASRLDEARDISRYTIGLLVFLGLLGTFWGLLDTLAAIRDVIANIQVGGGADITVMFDELKRGLEAPLAGMGTAFSSSLFGLSGSLILGFLDLTTGQAQNRFYTELEDWLAGLAKLSGGSLGSDGEQTVPAYVEALLEQTAESLENLQRTLARGEESRIQTSEALRLLSDKMSTITDYMQTEQVIMKKLAETHMDLKPVLERISSAEGGSGAGRGEMDGATRQHIRNIDLCVSRLLEETRTGREDLANQVRSEIKLLARTVAGRADN